MGAAAPIFVIMLNPENAMNQAQALSQQKINWPDLSYYGVHFCVMDIQNKKKLIMVDENCLYSQLAENFGLKRHPQSYGVYIGDNVPIKFNKAWREAYFPKMKVKQISMEEQVEVVKKLLISKNAKVRLSQIARKGLSWHPNRVSTSVNRVLSHINSAFMEKRQAEISVSSILSQSTFLGFNFEGDKVYESGIGERYISNDGISIVSRENDTEPCYKYLRAKTNADFPFCAQGIVREMAAGHRLGSEDFERYMTAIFGRESISDTNVVASFQRHLDQQMVMTVSKDTSRAFNEVFSEALVLHENRPSYWRPAGSLPTPLPLSSAMQFIASPVINNEKSVIDRFSGAISHSWMFESAHRISEAETDLPPHEVFVGGIFNHSVDLNRIHGIRIDRQDHETILKSLESRADDGLSVFLTIADDNGNVSPEMKRILSWVGARYKLVGMADVDASMVAPGNKLNSRLMVIGEKKKHEDLTYAPPSRIPVLRDYSQLFGWAQTAHKIVAGEDASFDDAVQSVIMTQANSLQAPYIPVSQVSEPAMMTPRNLLAPIRLAIARITEEAGMDVDEYVASKLGYELDTLSDYFAAEQVDAIAMGIHSIDHQKGFIEADVTGAGKGRVVAALCLYSKRIGKIPLFMTENPDLFHAIYRDFKDIGALDEFKNPFIMSPNVRILSEANEVIARSPSKSDIEAVIESGSAPEGYDVILGTYGQFNRKPPQNGEVERHRVAKQLLTMHKEGVPFSAAIQTVLAQHGGALNLQLPALSNMRQPLRTELFEAWDSADDQQLRAACAKVISEAAINENFVNEPDGKAAIDAAERIFRYLENPKEYEAALAAHMLKPMALRQHWIRNLDDFILVADESHNMAGPASNTNANMNFAVKNAHAFIGSSATFASKEDNYGIYCRIFPSVIDVDRIAETLKKGGEPLAEIFSAMVVQDGRMVRREHDFSAVEIKTFVDDMRRERNVELSDKMANVLNAMAILSGELETIIAEMNEDHEETFQKEIKAKKANSSSEKTKKIGISYSSFGSRFYLISQQFLMALNADNVADLAIHALQNGLKPVIYAESTMETVLKDAYSKELQEINTALEVSGGEGAAVTDGGDEAEGDTPQIQEEEGIDVGDELRETNKLAISGRLTFKNVLRKYADNLFYAHEVVREGKKIISRKRMNLQTPELADAIAVVYKMIDDLPDVNVSPIDVVKSRIKNAGFTVGEISGRKVELESGPEGDFIVKREIRNKKFERDDFNNGVFNATVISKSGATGIDLQAGTKFADQSQRVFIPMKLPEAIVKFQQALGRVNRKDQVCAPAVYLPYTGLPGEKRYLIMFKQKLRKMNANVTANAETKNNEEYDAPDIINRIGNRICCEYLAENPEVANRLGFKDAEISDNAYSLITDPTHFIDKVTSRIMMLPCAMQEDVYNQLEDRFKAYIIKCEAEGYNPLSAHKYDYKAREVAKEILLPGDPNSDSVFSGAVYATEVEWEGEVIKGAMSPEDYAQMIESNKKNFFKYYGNGQTVANQIERKAEKLFPAILPNKFETVQEALADPGINRVKIFAGKIKAATEFIPGIAPGASYVVTGNDGPVYNLIVDVEYPSAADLTTDLSQYRVRVISDEHKRGHWIPMSALLGLREFITDWHDHNDAQQPDRIKMALESLFSDKPEVKRRVMLTGNLYRAAEFAAKLRKGTPATYTDENGVWHQVIAMATGLSIDDVLSMPVEVTDAKMAMDFLEHAISIRSLRDESWKNSKSTDDNNGMEFFDYHSLTMATSYEFKEGVSRLSVEADRNGGYSIFVNLNEFFDRAILKNEDLTNALGQTFAMCGSDLYNAKFTSQNAEQVLSILLEALSKGNKPLMMSMSKHNREWYHKRQEALMVPKVVEEDEFNIDALLESADNEAVKFASFAAP